MLSKQRLAKIEKQLQADIRWQVRNGKVGFDPGYGADWDEEKGRWVQQVLRDEYWDDLTQQFVTRKPKTCGACIVAAHVLHNQCELADSQYGDEKSYSDVDAMAKNLKLNPSWVDDLYIAVTDSPEDFSAHNYVNTDAALMAQRLRKYAASYTKKYKAEKKRRAKAKAAKKTKRS